MAVLTFPLGCTRIRRGPVSVCCWQYSLAMFVLLICVQFVSSSISAYSKHFKHSSDQDYDLTIPKIADISGKIVTEKKLKSYHANFMRHNTAHNGGDGGRLLSLKDYRYLLNISALGEHFNVLLHPKPEILAPGFKVYGRSSFNLTVDMHHDLDSTGHAWKETGCHFSGTVVSHGNLPAYISVCDGVRGIIRTSQDDYIIEPINSISFMTEQSTNDNSHLYQENQVHKVYKRSLLHNSQKHRTYEGRKREKRSFQRNDDETIQRLRQHSPTATLSFSSLRSNHLPEQHTVETLVVVDRTLLIKHGGRNVTTYVLTLLNMVAELYKDPSLGQRIDIMLVGLILLEGDEPGLDISYNADVTLNNFCSWQSVVVGNRGRQHDHAVLITGVDLCSYKDEPCDTLGFAPVSGMCNRLRSCTVNQDTGLSTAFTIAHEMGHNFGMLHDGDGNSCTKSDGKIMSPRLVGKNGQFGWSMCSKGYLSRFLNSPEAKCLYNKPRHVSELQFPNKFPGELYNADIQCKWQFGTNARLCTFEFGRDICKSLWCHNGNKRCETKFLPAAEGTSCGRGMWCRHGSCVRFGDHGPLMVDGGWSGWSEWSKCSRSCGGGVSSRERLCNAPLPQYGGKQCPEKGKLHMICNEKACPKGSEDLHAAQCSTYNKKPFRGLFLNWRPNNKKYNVKKPCEIHCIAEAYNYVVTIEHIAMDGMPCMGPNHICLEGECQALGCDKLVGSNTSYDKCGVCEGDNSTCKRIYGEYRDQPNINSYFPIAIIPKGALSIQIHEAQISGNYLAVRDVHGNYLLNGEHKISLPGEYTLGGCRFYYTRPYDKPESLESKGPLKEDLVIELLAQYHNPGISFEYYLPKMPAAYKNLATLYRWRATPSSCDRPCAGGSMMVSVVCVNISDSIVEDRFCRESDKPRTGNHTCNTQPCPPRWVPGEWSVCTRTCGSGKQKRKLYCKQLVSDIIDKKLKRKNCRLLPRPERVHSCNRHLCPPKWHRTKWSQCSVTCGQGHRSRSVTCRQRQNKRQRQVSESLCEDSSKRPPDFRKCRRQPCPITTSVPDIFVNQTPGMQSIQGHITPEAISGQAVILTLNVTKKEIENQENPISPRPLGLWKSYSWSQCSVTCGNGRQTRRVFCENERGLPSRDCLEHERPINIQICRQPRCNEVIKNDSYGPYFRRIHECKDHFTWCNLVPGHNACHFPYYFYQCCRTCSMLRL